MNRDTSKSAFCVCGNKDADQLNINCAADQYLSFRGNYTIPPQIRIFELLACVAHRMGMLLLLFTMFKHLRNHWANQSQSTKKGE